MIHFFISWDTISKADIRLKMNARYQYEALLKETGLITYRQELLDYIYNPDKNLSRSRVRTAARLSSKDSTRY